ncbi:LamG-like jellyroll fold domain-containing protein [Bizionia sediminis]|uniref:LamG-like jellyroll fold domain-containing protein n=1 Tax=Bizionia sediminis TaxID=1737064 RepID=A0ABW5KT95_9FLAO
MKNVLQQLQKTNAWLTKKPITTNRFVTSSLKGATKTCLHQFLIGLGFFALTTVGQAQNVNTSTGSGTSTAPEFAIRATVEVWGAGGGGGGSTFYTRPGSGGGGGGYAQRIFNVAPGNTFNYSVGNGGSGNRGNGGNGGASTVTFIPSAVTVRANGGAGGAGDNENGGGAGGSGFNGTTNINGQDGRGAERSGLGYIGGRGGNAGNINNTGGSGGENSDGSNGTTPGGGGGGGDAGLFLLFITVPADGGDGANGQVRITYELKKPTITSFSPSTVCAGENLTITGTNLDDVTAVNIGGTAATIVSTAANTLVVTVGNGTTGPIGITTPRGSITSSSSVTVNPVVVATASISSAAPSSCNDTTVALNANGSGQWTAVSNPAGSYFSFEDSSNPNSEFTGESGFEYTLTWTINNGSCGNSTASVTVNFPDCGDNLFFDGTSTYANFGNAYNLGSTFSIEIWVKPDSIPGGRQNILAKRDRGNNNGGYDLSIRGNRMTFSMNDTVLRSSETISTTRWYHVAVTHNGTTARMYIDGKFSNSLNVVPPSATNHNTFLGGKYRNNQKPNQFFKGDLDELRIWNVALTEAQIRQMMNQEIKQSGTAVQGAIIPQPILGLNWNNLIGYYQMNQVARFSGDTVDIANGVLLANVGVNGNLNNMMSQQNESAPLPYVSSSTGGTWDNAATWENGSVQMIPNTNNVDWNIVKTVSAVNSGNRATTLQGLLVSANRYTVDNNQVLQITNYLKIDGVLDLEGESQLLQPANSQVDYTGTGALHRDQQGTTNLYNYNYWSSPVSSNGSTFQIGSVLHDGANPVNWVSAHNATGSSNPVTLSSRWLYLYENYPTDSYADWNYISPSYNVPVGLGFTMKGSGVGDPETDLQNYTFVGQPNNGVINQPVTSGNEALIGNPYPSAIDANAFINDNASVISGTLYFWEHSKTNRTHVTSNYEGGYAAYNLLGGNAATSPPSGLDSVGDIDKIPRRYIAVGQGFYVVGDNGGTITFNNGQRAFKKESEANTSVFFRNETNQHAQTEGQNDVIKRLRFNFKTPEGALRHILLGFTPNNEATDAVDFGYDARNNDYFPSDMSFLIDNNTYVIQGVGAFNTNSMYPLAVKMGVTGLATIGLTATENFDAAPDVYVYDALLGNVHRINQSAFEITLEAGVYDNRFFIVFQDPNSLGVTQNTPDQAVVNYVHTRQQIVIKLPNNMQIKQVQLLNMLGQTVQTWETTQNPNSTELTVSSVSAGNYIVQVYTANNRRITKKVVVSGL